MNPGEYFGELQRAVTLEWRKHLKTNNYNVHMILDEFYKELPEKIDALIEAWQSDHDVIKDYGTCIDADGMDATTYLSALKDAAKDASASFLDSSELKSLNDDIISQIDATLYKMTKLAGANENHNRSLRDFMIERLETND